MNAKVRIGLKKIIAGILLVSLVGCSANTNGSDQTSGGSGKERAASVAKGTLDADSVIISVGSTKVTYREYQVYSYLLQSKYETMLDSNIWKYSIKKDRTIGTEAIEEIIRLIIQLKVMEKDAKEQNISLTVDEKEEISFKVDKYFTKISDADKKKYNLTAEMIKTVLENNVVARMMYDIVTGSVDVNISQEEEKIAKVQMIYLMTKGTNKHNEEVNLDAAAKTALFDKANELKKKADKGTNFFSLAEKESSISKIDFDLGAEDEPKEVAAAALKMKADEVSNVISTDSGYYILYCISNNEKEAVKAHREALIMERQTKAFQENYAKWAEKYEVRVSESILERELFE